MAEIFEPSAMVQSHFQCLYEDLEVIMPLWKQKTFFVTDSTHKSKSTKRDCQNLQDQLLIVNWTCYKRKRKNGNFDYSLSKESKLAIYNGQFFYSSDFIAKEGLSYYVFSR